MTSLYPTAKTAFARGQINWESDKIRASLVDSRQFRFNPFQERSQVVSLADQPLQEQKVEDGTCFAADLRFPRVVGSYADAVVLIHEATGRLIFYGELPEPLKPNGGEVAVRWDKHGIFEL